MPKVSVLIPAYNVESFLPRCLDSILAQSYDDFEVILIDDGSTDGTASVCDDYAKRDARIKVFHQENRGISVARNMCLQHASGEYIQFVDGDDWIDAEEMMLLVDTAQYTNSDIVSFDFRVVSPRGVKTVSLPYKDIDEFRKQSISSLWTVLWKNLIRRTLFGEFEICFPEGIDGGEDYYVVSLLSLRARKAVHISRTLYNYNVMNPSSTMKNIDMKKIWYQIDATILFEREMQNMGCLKKYKKELLRRKFCAKLPMLGLKRFLWLKTFPESSFFFFWCSPLKWVGTIKSIVRMLIK